jgi:hypothetical protein
VKGDSILLHIDGAWGSGKSSLLNLMRTEFKKKNWIVVDFNAWKTQSEDHPWWQIMDAVYKEIVDRGKWKKNKNISFWRRFHIFFREHLWRLSVNRRSLYFLILAGSLICIGGILIYWSLSQAGGNSISHIQDNISPTSTLSHIQANITTSQANGSNDPLSRVVIALGGTGAGIVTILGGFVTIIGTMMNTVTSESTAKRFKESASDPMNKIRDHFIKLTHRIVGSNTAKAAEAKSTRAVVILVDDLDRCKDSYVVRFLQHIQTLFRTPELSCVVAADRRWLYTCFEKEYENFASALHNPGYSFGKLFLDKIFQFSVSMPSISDEVQKRYWNYLLKDEYDEGNRVGEADDEMRGIDNISGLIHKINTIDKIKDPLYHHQLCEAAVRRLSSKVIVKPTENLLEPFYQVLTPQIHVL